MTMPKAKYILRATKVDRIAIVDRPAVPNARILLFKRQGENGNVKLTEDIQQFMKSQFGDSFLYSACEGAVSALQNSVYIEMMVEEGTPKERAEGINEIFDEFTQTIFKLMDMGKSSMKVEADQSIPSAEEITAQFNQQVASQSLMNAFNVLRGNLCYAVMTCCAENADIPMSGGHDVVIALVDAMRAYALKQAEEIIAKGLKLEPVVVEKEGRIVSSARIRKLKEMHSLLGSIITESETKASENRRRRGGYRIMDKAQQDKLNETLTLIGEQMKSFEARILTMEEKSAKTAELDKALADANVALKALTETVEAVKNASDSAMKPVMESLTPLHEKAAKLEADLATEKSAREAAEGRLDKVEKALAGYQVGLETLGKRLGVRTSVEGEITKDKNAAGDVFGDAVRGKK